MEFSWWNLRTKNRSLTAILIPNDIGTKTAINGPNSMTLFHLESTKKVAGATTYRPFNYEDQRRNAVSSISNDCDLAISIPFHENTSVNRHTLTVKGHSILISTNHY